MVIENVSDGSNTALLVSLSDQDISDADFILTDSCTSGTVTAAAAAAAGTDSAEGIDNLHVAGWPARSISWERNHDRISDPSSASGVGVGSPKVMMKPGGTMGLPTFLVGLKEQHIVYWSAASTRVTGYTESEAYDLPLSEVASLVPVNAPAGDSVEQRLIRKDGSPCQVVWSVFPGCASNTVDTWCVRQ
jgi:hypothetical protein